MLRAAWTTNVQWLKQQNIPFNIHDAILVWKTCKNRKLHITVQDFSGAAIPRGRFHEHKSATSLFFPLVLQSTSPRSHCNHDQCAMGAPKYISMNAQVPRWLKHTRIRLQKACPREGHRTRTRAQHKSTETHPRSWQSAILSDARNDSSVISRYWWDSHREERRAEEEREWAVTGSFKAAEGAWIWIGSQF